MSGRAPRDGLLRARGLLDCEVVVTNSGAPAMLDRIPGEVMHPVVGPMAASVSRPVDWHRNCIERAGICFTGTSSAQDRTRTSQIVIGT